MGPSPDVTIRNFQPDDEERVKDIFKSGMLSLVPNFYKAGMLRNPKNQIMGYVSLGLLIGWIRARKYLAIGMLGLVAASYAGYMYYVLKKSFGRYVASETQKNLSNICESYKGGAFLVAEVDGQVVGMVGGEKQKDNVMELKRMSVDTTIHSRGVGTKIVQALEEHAKKRGYSKIILSCSSPQVAANRLYTKCGFSVTKEGPMPGFPAAHLVHYEKKL